jgi:hypothetical protein
MMTLLRIHNVDPSMDHFQIDFNSDEHVQMKQKIQPERKGMHHSHTFGLVTCFILPGTYDFILEMKSKAAAVPSGLPKVPAP